MVHQPSPNIKYNTYIHHKQLTGPSTQHTTKFTKSENQNSQENANDPFMGHNNKKHGRGGFLSKVSKLFSTKEESSRPVISYPKPLATQQHITPYNQQTLTELRSHLHRREISLQRQLHDEHNRKQGLYGKLHRLGKRTQAKLNSRAYGLAEAEFKKRENIFSNGLRLSPRTSSASSRTNKSRPERLVTRFPENLNPNLIHPAFRADFSVDMSDELSPPPSRSGARNALRSISTEGRGHHKVFVSPHVPQPINEATNSSRLEEIKRSPGVRPRPEAGRHRPGRQITTPTRSPAPALAPGPRRKIDTLKNQYNVEVANSTARRSVHPVIEYASSEPGPSSRPQPRSHGLTFSSLQSYEDFKSVFGPERWTKMTRDLVLKPGRHPERKEESQNTVHINHNSCATCCKACHSAPELEDGLGLCYTCLANAIDTHEYPNKAVPNKSTQQRRESCLKIVPPTAFRHGSNFTRKPVPAHASSSRQDAPGKGNDKPLPPVPPNSSRQDHKGNVKDKPLPEKPLPHEPTSYANRVREQQHTNPGVRRVDLHDPQSFLDVPRPYHYRLRRTPSHDTFNIL